MSLDDVFVYDIITAARKIVRITKGLTQGSFIADETVPDSVIRQITIIAEAAKRLSESFKETHDAVPWHEMRGMRNRLIHDYKRIDFREVWKTVQEDIPKLIRLIEPLVPPEESLE